MARDDALEKTIYIRDPSEINGWRFLCDSEASGGLGSALTGAAFMMVIDETVKGRLRHQLVVKRGTYHR